MMNTWGMTDVGLVRKDNQDAYAMTEHTASGHTICVVCDGMGGAAGGQLASRIAVETFTSAGTAAGGVLLRGVSGQQGHPGGRRPGGGVPGHGHDAGVRRLL